MRRFTQSHWFGTRLTIPGWGTPSSAANGSVGRQRITPFLWFNNQAEEAAKFYVSIFRDSRILSVSRYGVGEDRPEGGIATVRFQIAGMELIGLNGGPFHRFTEAVSLVVNCETQAEVDAAWDRLSEGGTRGECGWLRDRYGFHWQVVPIQLGEMLTDPDPGRVQRVMDVMVQMKKLDLGELRQAYNGG